ncbi:FAST kinase domain-containing protein 4 [Condylostylus longicornis]|uniref:FAST kinase domain-containing protein 4 n=1 Tax=Condylostylus longicornis TaxID=2530218 RepID=UPI00244E0DC2|nr:FAST kinase domain-containing protein 4 [Condylostylus longicornis]
MLRFSLRALNPLQNVVRRTASMTAPANSTTELGEGGNERKARGSMVAAAFASLKEEQVLNNDTSEKTDSVTEKIINAKTVNGLLGVTETQTSLSRKHALKVVSILAEWSSINRVKLNEFENDPRFLKVCRVLGRTVNQKNNGNNNVNQNKRASGFRTDDLNMVLGVTGDDEAAKLIASISPSQMVKVMTTLAQRKRRSTPLLRSLAYNLSSSSEQLDLKQCADVLFAMASLNFPDSVLAAKICSDIQVTLSKNTNKSAVVGSILTSLGLLRYRDIDVLESLSSWVVRHYDVTRIQDFNALLLTLAILNYKPSEIEKLKNFAAQVTRQDLTKPFDWLNHVWTLVLLRIADAKLVESVLSNDFINELKKEKFGLTPNLKMKLLNVNGYAQLLLESYSGPLIQDNNEINGVPMAHNKSKQILIDGMLDALKSLTSKNAMSLVDSKMGFLIDAKCLFDFNRNPLPFDSKKPDAIKVAIMVVDFHDLCHGTNKSLNGIMNLSFDLLEKLNYKVLPVPYHDFNNSDKLLKRVQYLEGKFKEIVNKKN